MLVSTISNLQGKMVGRDGFEPSTNWLKGIRRKPVNQRVRSKSFTEKGTATPLRINNLRVGFTELFRLKTLLVQSRGHNSEVVDVIEKAGVLA
tara:strand:- start:2156 stop:2434 length:279 start_codon:yes stop_codon:yes gene_type:complete